MTLENLKLDTHQPFENNQRRYIDDPPHTCDRRSPIRINNSSRTPRKSFPPVQFSKKRLPGNTTLRSDSGARNSFKLRKRDAVAATRYTNAESWACGNDPEKTTDTLIRTSKRTQRQAYIRRRPRSISFSIALSHVRASREGGELRRPSRPKNGPLGISTFVPGALAPKKDTEPGMIGLRERGLSRGMQGSPSPVL